MNTSAEVVSAGDITISPSNNNSPLHIQGSNVVYDNVTLEGGGYIVFDVSSTFTSTSFTNNNGNTPSAAGYDIVIKGKDGTPGRDGDTGAPQQQAAKGSDAQCYASTSCEHYGKNGKDGQVGNSGTRGEDGHNDAEDAPLVTLNIGVLYGSLTLLNVGGAGGAGGAGGTGGVGQQGGNGGSSKQCGGAYCHGGDGGNGGDGGSPGDGGNGADGANGSVVTVYYTPTDKNNIEQVIPTCLAASGGKGGGSAVGGGGGEGGNGGGGGGRGNPGQRNTITSIVGVDGMPGSKGSVSIHRQ